MHAGAKLRAAISWGFYLAAGLNLCIWLTACRSRNKPQPQETERYQLKGQVVAVDKPQKKLKVDHEAIPGFMSSMTMPYPVRDARLLEGLAPGDQITADVRVNRAGVWLENIVLVKKGDGTYAPPIGQFQEPLAGEEVPNFVLVNQNARQIRLHEYRGKALLITFVYTRCPFPDYCPLMTQNFVEIEKALGKDPESYAKTHLLSISFDPEYDTPQVLRAYGSKYVRQRGTQAFDHWEFAVTPAADKAKIAAFFGLAYRRDNGVLVHSLSTTLISPDGKIYKWYNDNTWKPKDVLQDLTASLRSPTDKLAGSK